MPAAKYIVELSDEEHKQLRAFITKKKSSARKLTRARILLKADERARDEAVVRALDVGIATAGRVRQRLWKRGWKVRYTISPGRHESANSPASKRPT
ncbi:MAG: hypothetical protein ACRD1R_04010 [Acidobacteriota bacterium]